MTPPIPPEIRKLVLHWHGKNPTLSSDELAHRSYVSSEVVRTVLTERYGGPMVRRLIVESRRYRAE